jgi:hypothetical protein
VGQTKQVEFISQRETFGSAGDRGTGTTIGAGGRISSFGVRLKILVASPDEPFAGIKTSENTVNAKQKTKQIDRNMVSNC